MPRSTAGPATAPTAASRSPSPDKDQPAPPPPPPLGSPSLDRPNTPTSSHSRSPVPPSRPQTPPPRSPPRPPFVEDEPEEEDDEEEDPDAPLLHENDDYGESPIEHLNWSRAFDQAVRDAQLDKLPIPEDVLARLKHAEAAPPPLSRDEKLSLRFWLKGHKTGSDSAYQEYADIWNNDMKTEDPPRALLSEYKVETLVRKVTGIVPIKDDMCVDSCLAFTGPFKDDIHCRTCGKDRY
jgi:hypothetical protein